MLTQCSSPHVCHVTHVIYQVSHVRCNMSGVLCQLSYVTSNSQTIRTRGLTFWERVHLLPPVICHVSSVTCHVSHFFFTKLWNYLLEGLLVTGPTPSSFPLKSLKHNSPFTVRAKYLKVCQIVFLILKLTRAETAQTHGPPRSVLTSFLLHNDWRTCGSSPTAVPGLQPGLDMFVLVCLVRWLVSEWVILQQDGIWPWPN